MLKENRKIKGRSEIKEKGARPQPRPGPRPPDRPSPPTTAPGSPLLPVPPTGVATGASPVGPVHRRRQGDKVPGSLFLPCSTHSPRLPSLASQIHALLPLSVSLARLTRAPSPPSPVVTAATVDPELRLHVHELRRGRLLRAVASAGARRRCSTGSPSSSSPAAAELRRPPPTASATKLSTGLREPLRERLSLSSSPSVCGLLPVATRHQRHALPSAIAGVQLEAQPPEPFRLDRHASGAPRKPPSHLALSKHPRSRVLFTPKDRRRKPRRRRRFRPSPAVPLPPFDAASFARSNAPSRARNDPLWTNPAALPFARPSEWSPELAPARLRPVPSWHPRGTAPCH